MATFLVRATTNDQCFLANLAYKTACIAKALTQSIIQPIKVLSIFVLGIEI